MSADTDKLVRSIYAYALHAKDKESIIAHIEAMMGPENVAIVRESLSGQYK